MKYSTQLYIELYKRKQFDKIPVAEYDGVLYYLSSAQLKALNYLIDDTTFYVGYGGSGRSGKTLLECFFALFQCLSYDDVRYMIGRSELKNLKATTIQTLLKTFNFYGLVKDVDYFYNDKESFYYLKNSSRIILRDTKYYPSDPEMTDLGGLELTGAILDESVENKEIVINILTSRIGNWNNKIYKISAKLLEGFNPAKNHVHYRYWKPFRDGKETLERKFVRALSSDNPSPEVRDWERNILLTGDKITIQRLLHGNFDYDDDDNALCNFNKINDIFTNDFVGKDSLGRLIPEQTYLSVDIAISNDCFVAIAWSGMRILDIKRVRNISPTKIDVNDELAVVNNRIDYTPILREFNEFSMRYNIPRSNIYYDASGIGNPIKQIFPGANPVHSGKVLHKEYNCLKSELEFELAKLINNSSIFCGNIDASIKELLIEELQMLKRDSDVGEKLATIKTAKIKEAIGRSPDIMKAVSYRIVPLLQPKQQGFW